MSVSSFRPAVAKIAKRWYSAQAATSSVREDRLSLPKQDVQISKLANGLTVASLENYSPISKISVVVNAGSRYESSDNLGVTHCLRTFANLTSKGSTMFSISRGLEAIGANLEVTTTREHMLYTVQCLRDHLDTACHYLANVTTGQEFRRWEVNDNKYKVKMDLAVRNRDYIVDVIEQLHAAAFRSNLGCSLYTPEFMLKGINQEMLTSFVDKLYVSENMALVGLGVDHDDLRAFGEKIQIREGPAAVKESAKFHGGQEIRHSADSSLAFAAIGVKGVSLSSEDILVAGVLQHLMGSGQYIKWGSNIATSRLNKSASSVSPLPSSTNCFNLSYSDAGLFGVCAIAQSHDMNAILKSVMGEFRSATKGNFNAEELQRGKNQLKASLLMNYESQSTLSEDIAVQAMATGQYKSVSDVVAAVDSITVDETVRVAKKLFNGKPSLAVSGNLSNTGYLDDLLAAH